MCSSKTCLQMYDDASSMYGWNGDDFDDISGVQQLGNDLRDALEQNVYYDEVDDSGRSDDNRLGDTDDCNDDTASSAASRDVDVNDIDEWSLQCDRSASPHDDDDVERRESSSDSADYVDTHSSRDNDDCDECNKKMRRRNEREKEQ